MKFSHINCRSLYRKITQVGILFANTDVLCCSETWLSKLYLDHMIAIPGKTIFRQDRCARGGGVCIYVNTDLGSDCTIDKTSSFTNMNLEIISLDLKKPNFRFTKIICLYRPPRGDVKKCIEHLTEILSRKENFKKEIWILGDFNVDYLKRDHVNTKRFKTFFNTYGLHQLITDLTRPGISHGTCIDWIISNSKYIMYAKVTTTFLSDHFAVECVRKKAREVSKCVCRTLRDYKNYNNELLIELLLTRLSIDAFIDLDDPNAMWDQLYNHVYEILSVMCPFRKYKQRESPTPWITAEIYRAIRYRDSLVNLFKATQNSLYITLAKQQRNVVNSMIESAKRNYILTVLNNNISVPKKFWRQINTLLKGEKTCSTQPNLVDPVTKSDVPKGSEANFLNEYYCNIAERLGFDPRADIVYNHNEFLNCYNMIENVFDILDDPPTLEDIAVYVDDIDLSKSSCVDGISTNICKDLLKRAPRYFQAIFKKSVETGIFPRKWSQGVVTVIPKSGNLSDPSNWRPITQTPIFAKVFEKIIHNRVMNYFNDNDILSVFQYGFRKGKSTNQAIFDLVKYIYSGLNRKKLVGTVCLDVAKAFDCLNHDILIYKMAKIGFSDNTCIWFRSYLTRTQVVKFDDKVSNELNVLTGIGQGTILGPLLFLFYINDIISVLNVLKINMYADDCILYTSGNEWNRLSQKIQPELDNIYEWCNFNRLRLNIDKSKTLVFGSRSKLQKIDHGRRLMLGPRPLIFTDKYKYLGVTLDCEMSLTSFLADRKKIVLQKLFNLRKLRYYVDERGALAIYKHTILPIFDYAGFMLIACSKSDRHDLQVIQNDALRTCLNVKRRDRLSILNMHTKANLLSLEQRRTLQLLNLMFMHKNNPVNLRPPVRNTRAADRE